MDVDRVTPAHPEVVVVDDQLTVRAGVELLLRDAGYRIAGLGTTVAEAAGLLERRRFDVVLMEAVLGGAPTAAFLAGLLERRADLPLVVYAGRDDATLQDAADADPPGLVLKSSSPAVLLDALGRVAGGERYLDPAAARRLPDRSGRPTVAGVARLSPRERQILGLLATGRSGAQIASELYLSTETVRTHVRNAVQKLRARTRTHAVALLVEHDGGLPGQVRRDESSSSRDDPPASPA